MAGSLLEQLYGEFVVHDLDEASDPKYYGFVGKDDHWYIIEYTEASGTFRYASRKNNGNTDYPDAWTGRAGLTYGYIYQAF